MCTATRKTLRCYLQWKKYKNTEEKKHNFNYIDYFQWDFCTAIFFVYVLSEGQIVAVDSDCRFYYKYTNYIFRYVSMILLH